MRYKNGYIGMHKFLLLKMYERSF